MEKVKKIISHLEEHMRLTHEALQRKLASLNVGRAKPELLSGIKVEVYGALTPLNQVANITVQDALTMLVNVWDISIVNKVDAAIRTAALGLNTTVDGNHIKIIIPRPSEERRKELAKLASNYTEESKVVQKKGLRREALDALHVVEKEEGISEDEIHTWSKKIEAITSKWAEEATELYKKKIKELESV